MYCTDCGAHMACYEGETNCPDCKRYEIEEEAARALDEAVRLRQLEAEMAAAAEGPAEGELSF
jgi:uncharacterized Zn finger protein (UPF0148 family)